MQVMKKKKIQVCLIVVVLIISTFLIWISVKSPIMASMEEKQKRPSETTEYDSPPKKNITNKLEPVENSRGLRATPRAILIEKNAPFPDLESSDGIYDLLTELVIPPTSNGANYRYVDAAGKSITPSSKKVGFQTIYVEITEKANLSSIHVPIPVSIVEKATIREKERMKKQSKANMHSSSNVRLSEFSTSEYVTLKRHEKPAASIFGTKNLTRAGTTLSSPTFEWVKNKSGEPTEPADQLDTTEAGFRWGYIKISDKLHSERTTIVQIPMMITEEKHTTVIEDSKVGIKYEADQLIVMENEVKGRTKAEISEMLQAKLNAEAWELTNGQELETYIENQTINSSSLGVRMINLVTKGAKEITHQLSVVVYPEGVFEGEDPKEWQPIPADSDAILVNPINGSKAAFPERGLNDGSTRKEGFIIQDKDGERYTQGVTRVASIPAMNRKVVYGNSWDRTNGLGMINTELFTKKEFLRKGNKLKQIIVDEKNQLIYVYNLLIGRNLNFVVKLDTYNISSEEKSLSMLEKVDLTYYTKHVPIYALGNNSGFYLQPKSGKRLTFKLKDAKGQWLSEYTKYKVITYSAIMSNYFGDDFTKSGDEVRNSKPGDVLMDGSEAIYQFGAPWQNIPPGKALKTGYEVFIGDELPYMELKASPNNFNVYEDYKGEFSTKYHLSKIPTTESFGKIDMIYPDGSKGELKYTADKQKEFSSEFTIPRNRLPKQLNEEEGTIKRYSTVALALEESDSPMNGLISNEEVLNINVYNLGAKPFPQLIKKGTKFNKAAKEIVVSPVVLPGHTATFKYEGDTLGKLDTSTAGVKSVLVRMTDTQQPEHTTLIEVPIHVVEETPPIYGIYLSAGDFQSNSARFQNVSKSELDKLILEKSNAYSWDIETGLSDEIKVSVETTTLTANPEEGEYTAVVRADKKSSVKKKTITIVIRNDQKVNVTFIGESGEELHQPVVFNEAIGTTIDLTKEENVQKAIQSIYDRNFQLVEKPENETAVPVKVDESTVEYKFAGKLYVQSSPMFFNFGRKSLGIPFIKVEKARYDAPLVIWDNRKNKSTWNLTATLKKPLTSREDSSKVLPSAIRYKVDDKKIVILSENQAEPIATRRHGKEDIYDLSQEWDENKSGMILEVPSGEVLQAGAYRATILWRVEQTP